MQGTRVAQSVKRLPSARFQGQFQDPEIELSVRLPAQRGSVSYILPLLLPPPPSPAYAVSLS